MYTSFFGFKENPFNLTPDPRYLFLSRYHKEALDHLLYGINERKGFIAITGGIGTGKTTLCRALLSHLDASTKSALIFNSFISDIELLKTINQEFGIPVDPSSQSQKEHIDVLNRFLLNNFSRGGNAVLLLDEAQNLSHTVLEQIRMLSNLETEKEKLIQIVLVGQSELRELLTAPSLRQLNERITVRYDLRPLDSKDIQGYVEHRLVVAGGQGHVRFTEGVFKKIYAYSHGNPRRINAVCDRALLIAYVKEKHTISKSMVGQAIEELYGELSPEPLLGDWSWKKLASSALIVLLLILLAGFAGWSLRERILGGHGTPPEPAPVRIVKPIEVPPRVVTLPPKPASLFLDREKSLTGLFDLFNKRMEKSNEGADEVPYILVSFTVQPEHHALLKKPFRIHLTESPPPDGAGYLLIRRVTGEGAIALDAAGRERRVSRDFVLNHWGPKLSWFYPFKDKELYLTKGTDVPEVLEIQKSLRGIGYAVEATGVYDESTFQAVLKFQMDFGLKADGITGPRTRALLFQMSE